MQPGRVDQDRTHIKKIITTEKTYDKGKTRGRSQVRDSFLPLSGSRYGYEAAPAISAPGGRPVHDRPVGYSSSSMLTVSVPRETTL